MSGTIVRVTQTGPTGWAGRALRSALPYALGLSALALGGCVDAVGDDVDTTGIDIVGSGTIAPGETVIGDDGVETSTGALTGSITSSNPFGRATVISTDTAKGVDRNNPFFQSLGTNGRACESCHKLDNTLGISVAKIKSIFDKTGGLDPIFRINDGSNAPTGFFARIGTVAERKVSFSMLLNHGVIRVGIPLPANADFKVAAIQDPYFFASAKEFSLFRRPMPSVNVAFNSLLMWDGRESEDGRGKIRDALLNQANDATTGHAEAAKPLTAAQRAAIADFQLKLFAAQTSSNIVGALNVAGCTTNAETGEECEAARGGPRALVDLFKKGSPGSEEQGSFPPQAIGINDPFKAGFKNISFTTFEPWESEGLPEDDDSVINRTRGDIGDGENLFYTKPIKITGVAGLNDAMGKSVVNGFCTTCHNTPDVGVHSQARFFNIGISNAQGNPLFTSDFPLYTFRRNRDQAMITVTDPGLALRTGKFADIGRFKPPQLRGLGARAPYFHNGMAKTLTDVVKFYNQRFNIGFTDDEIRKVVLFLQQT
jgi:cytochrome c peroxidase